LKLARLREIRELHGWSQSKLAEEADVSRDGISNYETGRREAWPSTAMKLADALGVGISDLVARVEESPLPKGPSPLSAEWALSLADEDTFRRTITDVPSQDLHGLVVDLVGDYQPRLFEDVRGKQPSPEDFRRVRAFARADIIAGVLRDRGEEAPESYLLALRKHLAALAPPTETPQQTGEEQEDQEAG